ncbi:hypothetical protein QFC21_005357 [Naganishia friedmannii]|uniref:Uncharacterized protein n=1 Tax=Naganishia friedmannii TaxID=89922 RepID=A0ACC2V9F1_9TREE|nr:hypothetical protein QFC21_005357 [Naganishia friedmannii]
MANHFQDAIVLFGDSLTQAWGEGSLAHLMSDLELCLIRSLPLFEKIFAKKDKQAGLPPVKLVTIWFGANDASVPGTAQSVPLEKYVDNLNYYISSLVEPSSEYYQPEARVILISPPPFVHSMRLEQPLPPHVSKGEQGKERTLERTREFKDACLALGNEWSKKTSGKVQLLDLWKVIVGAIGSENDNDLRPLYTDGLHLKPTAYRLVFDEIMSIVASQWQDLDPAKMKMTVPRYVAGTGSWEWYTVPPTLNRKAWAELEPAEPEISSPEKSSGRGKDEL